MSDEKPTNPLLPLWMRQYPFTYWDNRINKLNRYNPEDRLDALFLTLQLADLYTHLFVSQAHNPDQPWFMVKEEAMPGTIHRTLDKLSEEAGGRNTVFVEKLADNPEGLISFKIVKEDWDITVRDWIALSFLGCPAEFNREGKEVEFLEEPDLHYGGANAILNFWRENKALLNDFKHGFRVLPFDSNALNFLIDQGLQPDSEDIESLVEQLAESEQGPNWEQHILRMTTEKADSDVWYDYEVTLNLHRVNVDACIELSELALHQLHNLFGDYGTQFIRENIGKLFAHQDPEEGEREEAVVEIIEHVADFQVVYSPQ